MSATISVRNYPFGDAPLFQHRPVSIIKTDQSDRRQDLIRPAEIGHSANRIIDISRAGIGAIGAIVTGCIGTILVIDNNPPTGGRAAIDHELLGAIGTSSHSVPSSAYKWAETTKEWPRKTEVDLKPADSAFAKLRVERLASIQAALGVSSQALAEILRISRQGLYKWLDASKDTTLQEANRLRLTSVERIAKRWRQQSVAPLNTVIHETLTNGRTLFEILTDKELDEARVGDTFSELLDKLNRKPRSLSQKMAEAGFTRRPTGRVSRDDE